MNARVDTDKLSASDSIESARPGDMAAEPSKAAAAELPQAKPGSRGEKAGRLEQALLDRMKKRDRTLVFLIAVIAIGGATSAAIFGLLLREMQQGTRLHREAVESARETAQRQLRAYANVQDFKCGACGDNAGPEEVFVRAVNDGQTPALNVYARIGWNAGDQGCGTSGFTYTYSQARYFATVRTFRKDAHDVASFDLNREVLQQARSANRKLCVYGTVNYATIFDGLGERETRFCYWYSRGSERVPCEDHNDQN